MFTLFSWELTAAGPKVAQQIYGATDEDEWRRHSFRLGLLLSASLRALGR
jgi:hypothetical protein